MATAPVIIPGAVTKLAEAVSVDSTNTSTIQPLFVVPNGMRAVVLAVVLRQPNATMTASRTFTTGFDTSAVNVATGYSTLAQTAGTQVVYVTGGTINSSVVSPPSAGSTLGLAGATFSISPFSASAGATAVKVDVLGYLEAL